jgi:hypothetical protein
VGLAKVEIYGTHHCIESVCWWCTEAAVQFVRSDCDADGNVNITDAVRILNYIFLGGPPCNCLDAGDADDNGALNIVDPIRLLCWLFGNCPPLPAPAPVDSLGTSAGSYDPMKSCGSDPTADALGCASFGVCP